LNERAATFADSPYSMRSRDVLEPLLGYALRTSGKRLRSRVLVAAEKAGRGGRGLPDERVDTAARAIELTHLATLAHDDVTDGGRLRRGELSLPASFGATQAAAAGGLLFGEALELFTCCGVEAMNLATSTAGRICEGQMHELRSLYDVQRSADQYLEAITGKSAALFRAAALLGGMFGGSVQPALDALGRYGECVGVGYQIIDDAFDLIASSRQTGKLQGGDLRNGNYTLPVIYALQERPALAKRLQQGTAVEMAVAEVLETRGLERAAQEGRDWINKAKEAVKTISEHRDLLDIADEQVAALEAVL
jgi:heptaprenyl diphosphate synthase